MDTSTSSSAASPGSASARVTDFFRDDAPSSLPAYRLIFERSPVPMWVHGLDTQRMLFVNEAALRLYGYSRDEFAELVVADLEPPAVGPSAGPEQAPTAVGTRQLCWHRSQQGHLMEVELVSADFEFDGQPARLVQVRDVSEWRRAERTQRELAQRTLSTLESITDALFTLDRDWRFTYLNARAQQLLRRRCEELLGKFIWQEFPQAAGSIFQKEYERALAENTKVSFESFYPPLALWVAVDAYPSAQGLAVYFRDVTEKHLAEQRLREERETLSAVIDATTDAIIGLDTEGRIMIFNPSAERIFGYSRASMLGQAVELLMPARYRARHPVQRRQFVESAAQSRMMGLGRVKGLRADGQEIYLEGSLALVKVQQQVFTIASMRDVTQSLAVQADYEQSQAQLSELTHKLMTQEKALVKRLAQVLHDQLGQTMAAIRMVHETILTLQRDKTPSDIDRHEAQLGALINQAIREVRQVLVDLRPPLLDEQGLAAALDNELRNRALTRPELDIALQVAPGMDRARWPAEVEYAVFMIAREAIENALRHSGAGTLSVRLSGSSGMLQLEVADNGVGFKTGGGRPRPGHLGILGMRERAYAIGAQVAIDSCESGGTRVNFHWSGAS